MSQNSGEARVPPGDLAAIALCTLFWGTTWYAITLQFGVVDPVVSIIYRFALASALLFAWSALRGEPTGLTPPQHLSALGLGVFTFGVNYVFVYWAEERVTSAVVAVGFATLTFVNLIIFRAVFAQRASPLAWGAAGLGVSGVAFLSWEELSASAFGASAVAGIGLTLLAVLGAGAGNVFARRGELAGASVAASTAWGMAYGVAILSVFALATGRPFVIEWTVEYVLSLLYLAIAGSVIAFLLFFGLARRRGYASASYVNALTPIVAMSVSSAFEAKTWGPLALVGVALVLAGQWLLLRSRKN